MAKVLYPLWVFLSSQRPPKARANILLFLQMGNLRQSQVKCLAKVIWWVNGATGG